MILYAKFGEHQPLNRQSEAYAREGVDLDVSTLADHVGAGVAVLSPLTELIRRHVFAAARVHGDDTTVPLLARGKTITGSIMDVCARRPAVCRTRPAGRGYSSTRAIAPASILRRHLAGYAGASCRPTPTRGSASSTTANESRGRSPRRRAGAIHGPPLERKTKCGVFGKSRSCAAIHSALRRGTPAAGPDDIRSSVPYHGCGLRVRCAPAG